MSMRAVVAAAFQSSLALSRSTACACCPDDAGRRHQDSTASPVDTDKLLTIWLSLDDWGASSGSGALVFATGSHKSSSLPSLRKLPLQQRVAAVGHLSDAEISSHWNLAGVDGVPAPAFSMQVSGGAGTAMEDYDGKLAGGDASVHLGWTFHRAVRRHMLIHLVWPDCTIRQMRQTTAWLHRFLHIW
jgi:ectoine hydroxylase-related dioxygenase (phytanoyl-CoA dioxygenase family)